MPEAGWGEVAGLLAALTWGSTGLLIRAQGARLSSLAINALRTTVAAVLLVATWPLFGGPRPVPPEALVFLVVSQILGLGIGDGLYFEAIRRLGVARAMPISMAYPVVTVVLAVILLREPIGPLAALGIVLTMVGVYLVAVPSRHTSLHEPARPLDWTGLTFAVVTAICWAGSTLTIRPALDMVDSATANAVRMPLASLMLLGVAWRSGQMKEWRAIRGQLLGLLLATGLSSGISATFFLVAVGHAGAARAAVLTSTSPIFAVPLSIVFLGERGTWRMAIGVALSVAGVSLLSLVQSGS